MDSDSDSDSENNWLAYWHHIRMDLVKSKKNNNRKTTTKQGRFKYGEIPGIKPGTTFKNRKECAQAGVHAVLFAGIHGSKETGAYSVCLSGGYEDDTDYGDFFIYAGTGGQMNAFSGDHTSVGDQTFEHPSNLSLLISLDKKQPVRVVRKIDTGKGYRYDGLYLVEKAYLSPGVSGHLVCKFEFRRPPNQPPSL